MKVNLIAFILLVMLAAYAHSDTPQPSAGDVVIQMKGYHFSPEKITIAAGTTIEWVNTGKDVHTVTDKNKSWDSGNLKPGEKFAHRFDEKGTFQYICSPHEEIGMIGTIVVK
jgi:plastocyanin